MRRIYKMKYSTVSVFLLAVELCHSLIHHPGRQCALLFSRKGGSLPHSTPYSGVNSLLQAGFGGSLGTICITNDDVNSAFNLATLDAEPVPEVTEEYTPEDVAPSGAIMLEMTRILAQRFSLTPQEIYWQLPSLDISKTLVSQICPRFAGPINCVAGKYRRHDGLCNNLLVPTKGASLTAFNRLVPPVFNDGIGSPRIRSEVTGRQLPNPRKVSAFLHRDEGYHDHAISLLFLAWGQFMDHDFTLTATPLDPETRNEPEDNCCVLPPMSRHPECNEITIPEDDNFFKNFNEECIEFFRGLTGVRHGCKLGVRAPFNILTAVIDVNTVYGVTEEHANKLREFRGGLLRMNNVFKSLGLSELLPEKRAFPDEGCTRNAPNQFCFEAGEIRVNEQLILTTIHTLWFRQHNRIAKQLSGLNPHWNDERLYQESRRVVIAQVQHITFNEFLPLLLGKEVMKQHGILLQNDNYYEGYDASVDPSMTSAFITSAFRFGHSLLPSSVERWSPSNTFMGSIRLSRLIRQPYDLYRAGVLDEYYMGLMTQPVQAMDDSITQEITNHLFEEPGDRFGMDLVSLNLQRGREFGNPGYSAYRQFCNLPEIRTFHELGRVMTNVTAHRYAQLYDSVSDIDLWSAGVSERPAKGSLLGPTFSCIVATQMRRVRQGDRYWYENPGQPSSFNPAQLKSLRQSRLGRVLCDNTDRILETNIYPMLLKDYEINPRVPCNSGQIPHLDLTPWIENPFLVHGL